MKKPQLFIQAVILFAMGAPPAVAAAASQDAIPEDTPLKIIKTADSTDGSINFRTFMVDVPEADSYFAEFWLCPAMYRDNTYTTFHVFVNDRHVGDITPERGNWQALRVKDCEIFDLHKGVNSISIATRMPESPDVEKVQLALTDAGAAISSEAYEEYLDNAVNGTIIDTSENVPHSAMAISESVPPIPKAHSYYDIPLRYTFYKTFSFEKGQEVIISSQSQVDHSIDVMFYGTKKTTGSLLPTSGKSATGTFQPGTLPNTKLTIPYNPASPDEMQGLNWRGPSEQMVSGLSGNKAVTIYRYGAKVYMRVPQDGMYLVRVRPNEDRVVSTANLNINNGEYSYNSVPISYAYVEHVTPADSLCYAVKTQCAVPGTDDPMVFIHSKIGRLVGFADDCPVKIASTYGLSAWDSYISMSYHIPTSAISINSYSSSSPASTCHIFADYDWIYINKAPGREYSGNQDTDMASVMSRLGMDMQLYYRDGMLIADSEADNLRVCVSDLSGRDVFRGLLDNNTCQLPALSGGMYIVALYDGDTVVKTQKIIIK